MSVSPRQRVLAAQAELAAAELQLKHSSRPWLARVERHEVATILLGGLASGFALSLLPLRFWGGIGALAGRTVAFAARSTLAPVLAGAAVAHFKQSEPAAPPQ